MTISVNRYAAQACIFKQPTGRLNCLKIASYVTHLI